MPVNELEKIIKIHVKKKHSKYGLELVSDRTRIPQMANFDKNEIDLLDDLLRQFIVSV